MRTSAAANAVGHYPWWDEVFGTAHRYVVLHGGRGGAKSVAAALYTLREADRRRVRVLCAREVQRTIADSTHSMLAELIRDLGLEERFRVDSQTITVANGSEFLFRGISDQHKTAMGLKSIHNIGVCWVDEAQQLTQSSLDLLTPTIRARGSRIIFTLNPADPEGAVYSSFVVAARDDALVRQINYIDNPWFNAGLESDRRWDAANRPLGYAHKWLGEPQLEVEGALWSQEMLVNARLSPEEYAALPDPDDIVVAVDPAASTGERSDYTGIVVMARIRLDGYVLHAERLKGISPVWAQRAVELLREYGASRVVVEVSGPGADALVRVVQQFDSRVQTVPWNPSGKGSKYDRATPVAGLYLEQPTAEFGRIRHVGNLHALEGEQLSFTRESVRDDLVDAEVCGAVELGLTRPFRDLSTWEF